MSYVIKITFENIFFIQFQNIFVKAKNPSDLMHRLRFPCQLTSVDGLRRVLGTFCPL